MKVAASFLLLHTALFPLLARAVVDPKKADDPDDSILQHNVIATPHIGGATGRSFDGIGQAVAANVERLRSGQLPANCVNAGNITSPRLPA